MIEFGLLYHQRTGKIQDIGVNFYFRGFLMNRLPDLTVILNDWPYDSENNVRFFQSDEGQEIMQIRQPMGIEQYNLDGRPDGLKPGGEENLLAAYTKEKNKTELSGGILILEDNDFRKLRDEGILYYYRYLALFQVGQYVRVARDTEHNLNIAELLEKYYDNEARKEMLQYRPYIRRMNAISKAMVLLGKEDTSRAMKELEKGMADIEALPPVSTAIFEFEKIRSIQHISQVISQMKSAESGSQVMKGFKERLSEELSRAIESEDYERAAGIRDRLRKLS